MYALPDMAMQTDIRVWYGARTVDHQAVTVPGPQPQRGPPSATGGNTKQRVGETNTELKNQQIASHSLVLAQWNAEGLKNKKPELQEYLRREKLTLFVHRKLIFQKRINSLYEAMKYSVTIEKINTKED